MNDIINLAAPNWSPADSYGRLACELASRLVVSGVHVNRMGDASDVYIKPAMGGILMGWPTNFKGYGWWMQAGVKIAITMWESTQLPPEWAAILNTFDAVILPARFLVDVFRDNGVTAPLYVIPLGVSDEFQYTRRPVDRSPVRLLTIADRGYRKGSHEVAYAFQRAFGDSKHVQLTMKARRFPIRITNPNIEVLESDMTNTQMAMLYAQCDAMFFAGREGFGLPPREFAATGAPAFALDWGGTTDDLGLWGYPLTSTMESAWSDNDALRGLGEWGKADVDDMATQMTDFVDHRQRYLEEAHDKALYASARYSWKQFTDSVCAVWQHVKEVSRGTHRITA